MSGFFRPVELPDFAAIGARQAQMDAQRQQLQIAQDQAAQEQAFNTGLARVAPGLASGQGADYTNALAQLAGLGARGAQIALPLLQQARESEDIRTALGGGAPAAMPAVAAPGGAGGIRTGAAIAVPANLDDADILARTLLGEAANQGEEGMRAVAHVVANRARQTGAGVRDVVLAPSQFEPWGTRRQELLSIPTTDPRYVAARQIAEAAIAGQSQDPTGGATHFLNPDLQRQLGRAQPSWAPEGQGRRIGAHVFYAPGGGVRTGEAIPASAGGAGAPAPQGNPYAAQIERLMRIGTPRAIQMAQALSTIANRPTPETFQEITRTINGQQVAGQINTRTGQFTPYPGQGTPQTVGTIPPGYQLERTQEGAFRMVPIPGGPADREQQRQARADENRRTGTERTGSIVIQDLDRTIGLLDNANLPVAGLTAGALARIPGTAAADAARLLDSVRANVGFAQLNQMRSESPTGAALGSVTERELAFLQSVLGSLDQTQSAQQFRDNLIRVRNVFLDIVHGQGAGPERTRPSFQRDGAAPPAGARGADAVPEVAGPGGQGTASPPPAAIPARPSVVPAGSAYSPSRRQWRAPDGRIFNQDGTPAR